MHESSNNWYEIDQLRVCVCASCPVCVCVQCACARARDVQHDMLGPVMVQRVVDLDLRYVHGDDKESRPHIFAAVSFENYPTAGEIKSLDFRGLQLNKVAFYFAPYADLRGIFL